MKTAISGRWAGRLVALVVAGVALALVLVPVGSVQRGAVAGRAVRGVAGAAAVERLASLPVGAQSAISAALGASAPVFAARRSGVGYRLSGGGVSARLAARGVDLRAGRGSLSMAFVGVGRGGRLSRSGVVSVRAHANRVVFDRGVVREWYAAGPLGIEQGFTVARRPAGAGGPLSLALGLGGSVGAQRSGSGVRFVTASGRVAFRYGGLSAIDARGRTLRAALELDGTKLSVRVWDRGARYPLRIDPLIQQGSKLTGGGVTGPYSQFGYSVALSADGNTALIGGPYDSSQVGAAWVFTRSGSTWTPPNLTGTGANEIGNGWFGFSVALSADGNTALIGGPNDNSYAGAAWVFTRSGSTWTPQGPKLTGTGTGATANAQFGSSVALSADGNTALIGGAGDNTNAGAALVFTRAGATWTPQTTTKLTGANEIGNGYFGGSVALSGDGNTALIGGSNDNGVGAAWVFTRAVSTWTLQGAKLAGTASGASANADFGFSVALSADGNTALIGAYNDNGGVGTAGLGTAWVFTRSGSTWPPQGTKLNANDESGHGYFGNSVALSADGNTALIGGYADNSMAGAAWAFVAPAATQASTTTGLGSSQNPSTVGQSVTFTATVSGASPSGTVNFRDGSTTIGSCGAQPLGGATATCTTSSLGAGSHGVAAVYSGDTTNAASTSSALLQRVVAPAASPPPASTGPPAITGTLKAGRRLSCSPGTWTNSPTGYTYQWSRGGTPIVGATGQSYTVQPTDEGLTLTCTVTASNAAGASKPATSQSVLVRVPFVARCPGATGRLGGQTLGLVTLGMTRAGARRAFTHSSNRGRRYQDYFCLTPIGVRVGYASPTVLNTLSRSARKHVLGRVVWASTSSAFYTVRGIRPGATLTAARSLGLGTPFHIGLNDWYTAPNDNSIAVLKVRHGIVQEIGIADKQLARTRKAQGTLMSSFS
jgi:hypothetical protein